MTEFFGSIATILAITGVIANNHKKSVCFIIWLFSNTITLIIHLQAGLISLALRDFIFLILAVHGLILWRRKENT